MRRLPLTIRETHNRPHLLYNMLSAKIKRVAPSCARGVHMQAILTTILQYLYLAIICLMTVQAIFNIRLRLYIWEEPQQAWLNSAPTIYREPLLSFTILLPAYHEEDLYADTIQKVYDLNYPKKLVQIIALLREHDTGTIRVAQERLKQL